MFASIANEIAGHLRMWMSLPAVHHRIESSEPSSGAA